MPLRTPASGESAPLDIAGLVAAIQASIRVRQAGGRAAGTRCPQADRLQVIRDVLAWCVHFLRLAQGLRAGSAFWLPLDGATVPGAMPLDGTMR